MTPLRWALVVSVVLALGFALWRPSDGGGVMTGFEARTLDARFLVRGSMPPPTDVAILGIDDKTLAAAEAFPLPRDVIADAVRIAEAKGARAVAFDLLLAGRGAGDADLAEALSSAMPAILSVSFAETGETTALETALARSALPLVLGSPPGETLGTLGPHVDFTADAWLGHANVRREADGALRRVPILIQGQPGLFVPALSLQAVLTQGVAAQVDWGQSLVLDGQRLPINRNNEVVVNFFGPTGTVPTWSLSDAAEADLDDRLVFIGATASAYGDRFATPFSRQMPGVEVLASLAANLMAGTVLRRDDTSWGIDVMLAVLLAISATLAASRSPPWAAFLATTCVWAGALALLHIAFLRLLWLDGTTAVAALMFATASGTAARLVVQRRVAANLARYHSPLLETVLAEKTHPDFDGRVQKGAVLFVDVGGFTTRSEALGIEATTAFLRRFHQIVEETATRHSGMVEQFAGDGAMICFGLPDPGPRDAADALACAEALFAGIDRLNQALIAEDQPPVEIRVGAHFGEVAAAVLGGRNQGHVTFVGDVVNATSRLQDMGKTLGAELVVSDELVRAIGDVSAYGLAHAGEVSLRNRAAPMEIWTRPRKDRR